LGFVLFGFTNKLAKQLATKIQILHALCRLEEIIGKPVRWTSPWFGKSGTAPATVIGKWQNGNPVSDHGKVSFTLQFHQSGDRPA
jgi:hypothetical protein